MNNFGNISAKRILNELKCIQRTSPPGISIKLKSEKDTSKLIATFLGFPDSPYHEGSYEVELNIPKEYPQKPPRGYFITKVWHPNISSVTGCICLDILNEKWSFRENLLTVTVGISSLLIQAEPNDPQDAIVAAQYINKRELFDKTAAYWNYYYAEGAKHDGFDDFETKITHLHEMGITKDVAIHTLSMKNWDLGGAIQELSGN